MNVRNLLFSLSVTTSLLGMDSTNANNASSSKKRNWYADIFQKIANNGLTDEECDKECANFLKNNNINLCSINDRKRTLSFYAQLAIQVDELSNIQSIPANQPTKSTIVKTVPKNLSQQFFDYLATRGKIDPIVVESVLSRKNSINLSSTVPPNQTDGETFLHAAIRGESLKAFDIVLDKLLEKECESVIATRSNSVEDVLTGKLLENKEKWEPWIILFTEKLNKYKSKKQRT